MAQKISFTRNYNDLSTGKGFQFEFQCDRCGTGYRTRFKPFALGSVSGALDAAGSILGGVPARTAGLAERARSATWEKAHDAAFVEAMEELKPEWKFRSPGNVLVKPCVMAVSPAPAGIHA